MWLNISQYCWISPHGLPFIFLYLPNGSGTTRSPGLVLNQITLNVLPGHGLSDSRLVLSFFGILEVLEEEEKYLSTNQLKLSSICVGALAFHKLFFRKMVLLHICTSWIKINFIRKNLERSWDTMIASMQKRASCRIYKLQLLYYSLSVSAEGLICREKSIRK